MQLLSSMQGSCKSLVMRVSRNPTDLSMIDIDENDLKVGVRLVGYFVACCFQDLKERKQFEVSVDTLLVSRPAGTEH